MVLCRSHTDVGAAIGFSKAVRQILLDVRFVESAVEWREFIGTPLRS
jgi:hypothetical protein